MSEQEKKELQRKGFTILSNVQMGLAVLIIIAGFIVSLLVQKELFAMTLTDHEKRITYLEERNAVKHDILLRIEFNLDRLMEEHKMKYNYNSQLIK